ncbi:MAG TPA: hypothetical protein VD837_02050 [Terriglobales bacterium]|nr:hypothetical protein [Terriglobales bacterium]
MTAEKRKLVQVTLLIAIVVAAVRVGYIAYQRHQANRPPETRQEQSISPDYYVSAKKLYAYDLASAREITKRPVWVKEGYRYFYYPYDAARKRADLEREAGLLGPIEKVEFTDVVMHGTPGDPGTKQMLAIFSKDSRQYAVPMGAEQGGSFQINIDEMFFLQDPRELYKHWSKEVWDAIEKHEVKPGMNEIQASFAVGMGTPEAGRGTEKTVNYPNGGNPLQIKYKDGRAVDIKPGAQS